MNVFILKHSHFHGDDIALFSTSEKAFARTVWIARERWEFRSDTTAPLKCDELRDDEVFEAFWDDNDQESFVIREVTLDEGEVFNV